MYSVDVLQVLELGAASCELPFTSQTLLRLLITCKLLTFKAQPRNAFFATVNQVFGDSSQLPTTVERAVIKSLSTVQITKQCSAVVGS